MHSERVLAQFCELRNTSTLQVRQRSSVPFILSSSIAGVHDVIEAHGNTSCDVIRLNLSHLGGITKAQQVQCSDVISVMQRLTCVLVAGAGFVCRARHLGCVRRLRWKQHHDCSARPPGTEHSKQVSPHDCRLRERVESEGGR